MIPACQDLAIPCVAAGSNGKLSLEPAGRFIIVMEAPATGPGSSEMKIILVPALVAAMCCPSGAAAATTTGNLILNNSFDAPDVVDQPFQTYNVAPPGFEWGIVADNRPIEPSEDPNFCCSTPFLGVDVVNSLWVGTGGTQNADGNDQSVDIDGATSIWQTVSTVPGQRYRLVVHFSSHPTYVGYPFPDAVADGVVRIDSSTAIIVRQLRHDTPNLETDMQWRRFEQIFTADGTDTTLTITGDADNLNRGFAVDDISITPTIACSLADLTTQGAGPGDPLFGQPDGVISASDLNSFVNAWNSADASVADVTTTGAGVGTLQFGIPDGDVTAADVNFFVNLWVAGCP